MASWGTVRLQLGQEVVVVVVVVAALENARPPEWRARIVALDEVAVGQDKAGLGIGDFKVQSKGLEQ